jgi:phage terminase large subunit GpA-like protein
MRIRTVADIPEFIGQFLQPPPKITVSDWADANRILDSTDSPEAGPWQTSTTPYMEEPMNATGDELTEEIIFMMASQVGKTAGSILNTLGYYIDVDPSSILLVYPTVTMAERVSRQRVEPMIRNCASLRNKIYRTTWGEGRSDSLLTKTYPGGILIFGGAEKASSLSQFPMRIILLDEIDRYKGDISKEGDPVRLAVSRAANYWNRKIILASTPTIAGASRIEFAYEDSSMGRWQLPCPACACYQELTWPQIDYTNYGGRILCKCAYCREPNTKAAWLAGVGKWVHRHPERRKRGYALNAIVSPWVGWQELVEQWIEANKAKRGGDRSLLKVFLNTKLAQTFEDYVCRIEPHVLSERREIYPAEIPDGVLVLTAGADVQDIQNRINYEIVGWGRDYESWGIEYGSILLDPHEKEWWEVFDQLVHNRIFQFGDGRTIRVRKTLIDSNGPIGPYIHRYTKGRQPRIFGCKGSGHERAISTSFTGTWKLDEKYGATWYPLNTVMGKDELFDRLQRELIGPGYCHFPMGEDGEDVRGYDNDFFLGLTSEQKHEEVNNMGYTIFRYKKEGDTHRSGEPLDCRNYARCALELVEQSRQLARMAHPDYYVVPAEPKTPGAHGMSMASSVPPDKVDDGMWKDPEEMGQKHQPASAWPLASKLGQPGSRPLKNFDPYRDD